MKTSVCKMFSFDAAHYLPNYVGKCHNLHGHTWNLEVEVTGSLFEDGPSKGMVIDFIELKSTVNELVIDVLDHTLLNDTVENPTCENLLDWIWSALSGIYVLERLRLYETPDSFAEISE